MKWTQYILSWFGVTVYLKQFHSEISSVELFLGPCKEHTQGGPT